MLYMFFSKDAKMMLGWHVMACEVTPIDGVENC